VVHYGAWLQRMHGRTFSDQQLDYWDNYAHSGFPYNNYTHNESYTTNILHGLSPQIQALVLDQ